MALNFPNNPTTGVTTYTSGDTTWLWNGTAWNVVATGTGFATINTAQTLTNKTIDIAANTLTGVQPTLVSGTSIKTINSTTLLGADNVVVQETLVSGVNIKTINSTTLLGAGNIALSNNADGGFAASVYLPSQTINGGNA